LIGNFGNNNPVDEPEKWVVLLSDLPDLNVAYLQIQLSDSLYLIAATVLKLNFFFSGVRLL
jgi:hypothetical protein